MLLFKLPQPDKIKHFFFSLLLLMVMQEFMPLPQATYLTFLIGFGKELVYDKLFQQGEPDWADIAFNALGCMAGLLILGFKECLLEIITML